MQDKIKVRIERCITNTGWYKNKIGETFDVINEIREGYGTKYYRLHNSNKIIELDDCCIISDTKVEWECVESFTHVEGNNSATFIRGDRYPTNAQGNLIHPNDPDFSIIGRKNYSHHFRKVTTPQHEGNEKNELWDDMKVDLLRQGSVLIDFSVGNIADLRALIKYAFPKCSRTPQGKEQYYKKSVTDPDGWTGDDNHELYPTQHLFWFTKAYEPETPQHDRMDRDIIGWENINVPEWEMVDIKSNSVYQDIANVSHAEAVYFLPNSILKAIGATPIFATTITLSTSQVIDIDKLTEDDKIQLRKI